MTSSTHDPPPRGSPFFQALLEQLPELVVVLDEEGVLAYVSPQMAQALGRSRQEMEGDPFGRHVHPDDLEKAWAAFHRITAGPRGDVEIEVRLRTRSDHFLSVAGVARRVLEEDAVAGVVFSARDVSARAAAIEALGVSQSALAEVKGRLAHAERVESIGRLAGTVAHDFNNFILAIQGTVDLLLADPVDPERLTEDLVEIRKICRRATALTGQLLSITRKQPVRPRTVVLDEAVGDLEPMLRRLVGDPVELVLELDAAGAGLRIDPHQLDQVLMNLVVNARDAVEGRGRVTVSTERRAVDEPQETVAGELAPGPWLVVSVRDDGVGMDPWTLERVFEPFFTTKAEGRGTGVGLSTVRTIVEQSEGRLRITTEQGVGTTFEIFFPLLESEAPTEAEESAPTSRDERGLGEGRTVLVIDDDRSVRRVLVRILEREGFEVIPAGSMGEAVESARSAPALDLVVSDLSLPEGSGPEAVRRVAEVRTVPAVLFVSGFSGGERELPDLVPAQDFLPKPFTPRELLTSVRGILAPSPSG